MKSLIKFILIIAGISFVVTLSYQIGILVGKETILRTPPIEIKKPWSEKEKKEIDFSIFWEAWRKLEQKIFDKEKIDYQKMVYGAIKGMINSLEDPYTIYFTPEETEKFEQEIKGEYEGVGMEIGIKDKALTIITPFENTPSYKAGIQPGDKILAINEIVTENFSLEEAVRLIRGPKGTKVNLLIKRKGWHLPKNIILIRETIKLPMIKLEFKEVDKQSIAYLKIYQFNQFLPEEFKKAAEKILKSSTQKIILDLRNNPGGILEIVQQISGWFFSKKEVLVWQDEGENKKKPYWTIGTGRLAHYPLVVLINIGSASGAEILAGGLRDLRNILLIGEQSFGKGSVQESILLSDNSSLKITTSKWLTPKEKSINEEGLVPDIEIKITEEDWETGKDPQLEKALELIKEIK